MLKSVRYPPVYKTDHILNYSLLLSPSQRVYLLAKTIFPPSAPLSPSFGSTFYVMYFRLPAVGRLFRPTCFDSHVSDSVKHTLDLMTIYGTYDFIGSRDTLLK